MLTRRFSLLLLCFVLVSSSFGCRLPNENHSITIVVDDRNLGGHVYTETINQILTAIPQQDFTTVKVLRLGNQQGSAYRAQIATFELPVPFDCESELLKDAPFSTKFKRQAREQYIEENKGKCLQKQVQYKQSLTSVTAKLRQSLMDTPDNRECISLATIGERLARESAALQEQRFILLTTGINSPRGCEEYPLPAVSLAGRATLKIVQLPLEGENKFYEKRTAQLQTVFPQGEITPSANADKLFSAEAFAKR